MFYKSWRRRLNHKIGQQIFLEAHKDYLTGNINRKTWSLYVAYVIAAFVIITPYLMIFLGAWVFTLDFPNLVLIIIGIVIAGSGWMMRPPRIENTERTYQRTDLPNTFAFFDVVAEQVGAEMIDGIHINAEMNGYMAEFGRGRTKARVLGLGLVLWDSATAKQRIAFAAHEMAHQINNDPARSQFIAVALHTLE